MYIRPVVPVALFVAGIAMIVLAVATGEAEVSLVVVFPLISGSGGLFLLGVLLMIFSFVVGFAMLAMGQIEGQKAMLESPYEQRPRTQKTQTDKKFGGVVLIGPVPIAFGSDKTIALIMLVAGIVLAIAALGVIYVLLQ